MNPNVHGATRLAQPIDRSRHSEPTKTWWTRLGFAALLGLSLAACSGAGAASDGVARLDSPDPAASPGASASADPGAAAGKGGDGGYQAMLAYSQCMREHGVTSFPDPTSDGQGHVGLQVQAGPGTGLDPNSATYKAADQTCHPLMPAPPAGGGGNDDQAFQQMLAYSQCMRDNGEPDFPDPVHDTGGGVSLKLDGSKGSGLDPNSATFKAAQDTCKSKLPGDGNSLFGGGPTGGGGTTSGGSAGGNQ